MNYDKLESYFDIDKFDLYNEYDKIHNKNIDECAYYAINKNSLSNKFNGGFEYKGNNDKCYLFDTQEMNTKLSNNDLDNYNIKTFYKVKNTIDFDDNENKNDPYKYFTHIHNKYYNINGLIDKVNVSNEKECLDKCLSDSSNKCKSIIYLEEPKKCTFYKNKDMKIGNKSVYNNESNNTKKIYTFKNNININNALDDIKNNIVHNYKKMNNINNINNTANWSKIMDNPVLYKCNGLDSTNPFCTSPFNPDNIENNELQYYTDCLDKNYENNNEQEKYYSDECKNKYGDEYIFDNDYHNLDTVINCDHGKRAKCKINMNQNNFSEHFSDNCNVYNNERITYEEHYEKKYFRNKQIALLFFLFIIIIIFLSKLL